MENTDLSLPAYMYVVIASEGLNRYKILTDTTIVIELLWDLTGMDLIIVHELFYEQIVA